jgi:predicted metal-dependent HD superfamily phosphohydrolase
MEIANGHRVATQTESITTQRSGGVSVRGPVLGVVGEFPELGTVPSYLVQEFAVRIRDAYGDPKLFVYHNFDQHVMTVVRMALKLADRVEAAGHKIDREVLTLAALGHDALFGVSPKALGFSNSEQVAASYTARLLEELGMVPERIAKVVHAIEATNFAVSPQSIEAKILRAADLSNLASPYETFRGCTELFYAENLSRGGSSSFAGFAHNSLRYLSLYMQEFIALTPHASDPQGRSVWHTAAMRNILQLFRETTPGAIVECRLGEFQGNRDADPRESSVEERLVVAVTDPTRSKVRESASDHVRAFKSRAIEMLIPGASALIPLPDQSCDAVVVSGSEAVDVAEVLRIGTVECYFTVRGCAGELGQRLSAAFLERGLSLVGGASDEEGQIAIFSRISTPLIC